MSRDTLAVLLRLRRFEVTAAQRDLATGLRTVADAQTAQWVATRAISHEAAAATQLAAEAMVMDLFCRWLPHGQAAVAATATARGAAEQAAGQARAALTAAHAAAEAVAALRGEQVRARRAAALRTEQAALDEHAVRGRRATSTL
jgi:flagellar export protein FliJ